MRIMMLSWEYPPRIVGGIARVVHDLSHNFAKQGHEVHVITYQEGDTKEFEKINMVEETADSILESLTDINEESSPENDIFNLIDSMYDEEEK